MDKLRFESADLTAANIDKIAELFPAVVTEGKVNFDLLRSLLGDEVYGDEAYEFTWVGKRAAIAEAGRPIRKALRPCMESSKNWDTTENLYIEGDNLDVLKLLQESYLSKVKMIYVDPPYNTGNDFVYRDNFTQDKVEYEEDAGVYDEDGDRLFRNTESNGRFHSDWCSMMYPRLVLARNLLRDDGVIFISIDDNEVAQLRKICDEVFGEGNFIAQISNTNNPKGRSDDKYVATAHEYVMIYTKTIIMLDWYGFEPTEEIIKRYNKVDTNGKKYREIDLRKTGENDLREDRPNLFYYFYFNEESGDFYPSKDDKVVAGYIQIKPQREDGKEGNWRWGMDTVLNKISNLTPKFMPARKVWGVMEKDYLEKRTLIKPTSSWTSKDVNSERGSEEFISLGFDKRIFPKPKPIGTINRCLKLATSNDSIVLDFFSGSATTAHAVMQLNAEDGGKRKFIMVQLPEPCAPDSEAAKTGYTNICEIGKERIRRAGEKIKEEAGLTAQNLNIGFRVLKLDDTNMKDVYYAAGEYTQDLLSMMEDNIKDDRTDMDLLYACLLDWGLPLSMPHTREEIGGFTVHTYNDGDLIACFDKRISDEVVKEIAKRQPLRAVFRDSSFSSSPEKINVEEIFKLFAPNTSVKVL
ncbi:MAG: site-specific DNA-methyltransferase [Eubacteriales bacterium]